jgi:hypothetical protein
VVGQGVPRHAGGERPEKHRETASNSYEVANTTSTTNRDDDTTTTTPTAYPASRFLTLTTSRPCATDP